MIRKAMYGPTANSSLAVAGQWTENLLLGSLGTAIAMIAVAWAGFAMMTGRLPLRRGAGIVLGMAILFGSHTIARGLMGRAGEARALPEATPAPPPPVVKPTAPPLVDPYAGASVPM